MKIGLDLRMASTDYGIGRYSLELVRAILERDRKNEYVLFVRDPAVFKKSGFDLHSNITLVEANYRHYSFAEQFGFSFLLTSYNLDLTHFLNFNVPLMYRRRFVATIHDLVHHKLPGNKKRRFLHRLAYRAVMRHAVFASKRIITVSNASKNDLVQTYRLPEEKIKVIYEAAAPFPVTDSDVAEVRQRYGIDKPYLIFVGVMERKKNVPLLAKGFDILKERYQQNVQLVLVGKMDPHYPEVLDLAKTIKYRKDLVITGPLTDKEKYALYKGAEVFVSASKFEGFGLPGVEAMSIGLPLAVSNTAVFNEVYDNGALYFNPDDPNDIAEKVNLLLTDQKYKQLVANNAYARAQIFSWANAAKQTIDLYNSLALE